MNLFSIYFYIDIDSSGTGCDFFLSFTGQKYIKGGTLFDKADEKLSFN